ncbi:eukaryotic translation initiation factor 2B delta subunit [Hysterangium stoloniferum]|nr:eukaryotic translation initiation factor 2B delta subunit [Hysterangium stoloniferum]
MSGELSNTSKEPKSEKSGHSPSAPKPTLTKAERRAKQEKEREAKAAAKAAGGSKAGGKAAPSKASTSAIPPAVQSKPAKAIDAVNSSQSLKDMPSVASHTHELLQETRGLRIFSHFGLPKASGSSNLKGLLHPAIFRLGLQFSAFNIVGANARCIATLNTFKTVIHDYVTPPNTTISRHLMTHLNPQIGHLVSARPLAVSMGNAIRHLKVEISVLDIDLPEQNAKEKLCEQIDHYIRDNIIMADKVIQDVAGDKIKEGDVILTYARSSVVEKVLLRAHAQSKNFSVIIADSRPLLEGRRLLSTLADAGIQCTYLLLPALNSIIQEVSIVMLGAHSVQSDGAVYSRAGTALVAMMAKAYSVPTLVCCETYKFSDAVHLDSFNKNELAPLTGHVSACPSAHDRNLLALNDEPNLQILNPLYDLTPPANITAIVTEVGTIPPNSVGSFPGALGW